MMNNAQIGWAILLIGLLIVMWISKGKGVSRASDIGGSGANSLSVSDKGNIIIYGSKTCPWCVKQEKYMKDKGIPYTFVNCPTESCPEYVKGFPTILIDNEIKSGYTEL